MLKSKDNWHSPQRGAMKNLPIGIDFFLELRSGNNYYVDKTRFIKTVMEDGARVMLITRPRRFGKTLFMDTIKTFLQVNPSNPGDASFTEKVFSGLSILEEKDFCRDYMAQYPTIILSLKSAAGNNFKEAYVRFVGILRDVARDFSFLLDSPRLSDGDKALFARYLDLDHIRDASHIADAKAFLKILIDLLFQHFGRQVVVLIDEYDVPLAKAASSGYYKDMLSLVRDFLSDALKPNPTSISSQKTPMKKAILTGCLRVSKESIFTGLNNPTINTVCSGDLTLNEAIGFTASEVQKLLCYYGLENRFEDVKRWYDGYQFAGTDIYCPWDVINFCSLAKKDANPLEFPPGNYWINTSGNDVIDAFLGFLTGEDAEKMQALVDGGAIEVEVNEALNYGDFKKHKSEDFWTLLLFTGYLTIAERLPEGASCFKLKIPNEEIRDTFVRKVKNRFSSENADFSQRGNAIAQALLTGDTQDFYVKLTELLQGYVSIRDTATKSPAENFYHGFLSAIFTSATVIKNFQSNAEAGNGYADILFVSVDKSVGVVIEIKRCEKEADSADLCQKALDQIAEKGYESYFPRHGITCKEIYAYGLVFFGKDCNVLMQKHEVKSN